jgi:hypothetical protein
MDASMIPIIYIFIIMVSAYITIGFFKVPKLDILIIAFAIVVLIGTMLHGHLMKKTTINEHFVTTTATDYTTASANQYKPIDLEEDTTSIKNNLVVYNTAYNKNSYNENGNTWINIAAQKSDGSCDTEASNSVFTFELPPIYSRKSGFYLGNNRLIGPLSNAFHIQYHNTFTMVIACKHGNLLVDNKNAEIELFKFYANSPNNNGISMYIQQNSLQNINNVQMGNLMFQYSNREPFQCKLQPDHNMISFEKDVLTFYFIIKDTDHIRVAVMTEKNTNVDEILRFNVENTDVTFSNKEFTINRLRNWNGNIFSLGIYNVALGDEDITGYYSHFVGEYMKYVNPNFISMIQQYNDTLDMLNKFMSCPYSKDVCDSCSTINKWNDMSQLVGASTQCRQSINDFCMTNMNHSLCKCWNTQNPQAKSDSCTMFKSIFTDKNSYFDNLTQDDIDYIMSKYGLITPNSCPKAIKTPGFIKNKYSEYDFDKLKIYLDENDKTNVNVDNVLKVYPTSKPESNNDDDYTFDKIKIKYDENIKGTPTAKDMTVKDLNVNNYYKTDPDMNYKLNNKAEETSELLKIKALADKEIVKLNDTTDLNIIPPPPPTADTAANNTYFDKFMKIVFK